ncbi:MAG: alpha/beta fold hydrolase [Flavobacteriaceae bacterium]|jgi:esterase|nr:alpha/beta fold hydrolase [Flavobacteriales bacterium]MDG1272005.1 alpha/beta fold hydrolase [Flavobacteriaceae bacterium]
MERLHANVIGDSGQDLLILHGFLGMGDNWKTLARQWSQQGFRVHLIDQRNHGRSFWDSIFSYEAMAADLQHYITEQGIEKCWVLGHSMGGKTAMSWACQHPEQLLGLVVADIAPKHYPPHHQAILKGLDSLDFSVLNTRKAVDEALAHYVPDWGFRQFLLKNVYWVTPGQLGLRVNIEVLKNAGAAVGEALPADFRCDRPTLFLKGARSEYILNEDQLLLEHHFSNSRLETIPDAGHFLHAENPTDFSSVFLDWQQQWR